MAKVVAPEGFALELDAERMTFGHSTEVEVPLMPELGIAERHFTIVRFGQKHFIEHDADRQASTKVNGQKITKHPLEDGDEISAGDLILTFSADEEGAGRGEENKMPEAKLSQEFEKMIAGDDAHVSEEAKTEFVEKPPLFDSPAASASELPPPLPPVAEVTTELPAAPTPPKEPTTPSVDAVSMVGELPPVPPPQIPETPAPTNAREEAPVAPTEAELPPAIPTAPPEEQPSILTPSKPEASNEVPALPVPVLVPPAPAPPISTERPSSAAAVIASPTTEIPGPPAQPQPTPSITQPSSPVAELPGRVQSEESPPSPEALPIDSPTPPAAPAEPKPLAPTEPQRQVGPMPTKPPAAQMPPLVTPIDEPQAIAHRKPGSSTQRINLASAISSALTPKAPVTNAEPNIAPPSTVERIEAKAAKQVEAPRPPNSTMAPTSTDIPGPPAGMMSVPPSPPSSISPPPAQPSSSSTIPAHPSQMVSPSAPSETIVPTASPTKPPTSASAIVAPSSVQSTELPPLPPPTELAPEALGTTPPQPAQASPSSKRSQKKAAKTIKPAKRKRPRKPLFPFFRIFVPGLLTLSLLAGGAYYAWENHFKPEKKAREFVYEDRDSDTFPTADIVAQNVLKYLPNDAEKGVYIDVRNCYSLWSAMMNPDDTPIYNPVDDFIFESSGLPLAELDYVCLGGDAEIKKFVAVIGFHSDLNPAELFSGVERTGSRLVRVETIGEIPLRVLERDGRELELVLIDQRTVLVTSAGMMRPALVASKRSTMSLSPISISLGKFISDGASFAISGKPSAIDIVPTFESFGCPVSPELLTQINEMETVSLSVRATTDIQASLSFTAKTPERAAQMTPSGTVWLATAPQGIRDVFRDNFPAVPLPATVNRTLESAEWATAHKVNRIRLSLSRRDLFRIVKKFQAMKPPDDSDAKLIRNKAENFASVFASAVGAYNLDLPKAGSVEKAMEMLIEGVRGREGLEGVEFRVLYEPSQVELDAIARHLIWDNGKLILRDNSATNGNSRQRIDDEIAPREPIRQEQRTAFRLAHMELV